MAIDMTEVRQLFFEESCENLDMMESNLLDLEIGPVNKELVNSIFRAAHSIKGGAGIFKFEQVISFAHVSETLLDEMRKGEHLVTQPVIDLLLRAVDVMRMMLSSLQDNSECNESEVQACQAQLKGFLKTPMAGESGWGEDIVVIRPPQPPQTPAVTPSPATSTASPVANLIAAPTLLKPESTPAEEWQIIFKPHLGMLKTGNDPIHLFRQLASLGALEVNADTSQIPTFAQLEPHSCYLSWELILHAETTAAAIQEIFEWVESDCELQINPLPSLPSLAVAEAALLPPQSKEEPSTLESSLISQRRELVDTTPMTPPSVTESIIPLLGNGSDGSPSNLTGLTDLSGLAPEGSDNSPSNLTGRKDLSDLTPDGSDNSPSNLTGLTELSGLTPEGSDHSPSNLTGRKDLSGLTPPGYSSKVQELPVVPLPGPSPMVSVTATVPDRPAAAGIPPTSPKVEPDTSPKMEMKTVEFPTDSKSVAIPSLESLPLHEGLTHSRSGGSNPAAETSSIRVSIDKVDHLINLVGELVITQSMLDQVGENFDNRKLSLLRDGLSQLERNTRELQESVMRIRMLPISFSFNRFPRLVHDLSLQLGKKVELKLSGIHTELDKTVLEKMSDPLVHLVRNALDHGIETPAQRQAVGKSETGLLHLHAFHQGGNIIIQISDDGAGFDLDKIREKAITMGLFSRDDHTIDDSQLYELIFQPGFSTADQVSDLSGRGVGMDVVRRNIRSLGGTIDIQSKRGQGSTFNIRLPLTLAILDGQLVRVGPDIYILSLLSIIESLRIKPQLVYTLAGQAEVYKLRDEYISILRLYELFEITPCTTQLDQGLLVIVEGDGQKIGLFVDELLSQQQIVIKSLESNFKQVPGISGATILGDGSVALILDVAGLIQLFHHKKKPPSSRSLSTLGVSP